MRLVALVLVSILAAPAAFAQDRTIDDACLRLAELEIGRDGLVILSAQSFPELSPPRTEIVVGQPVREPASDTARMMTIVDNLMEGHAPDAKIRNLASVRCQFEQSVSPMTLTEFSCGSIQYCSFYSRDRAPLRLEELRVLLEREGF